MARVSTARERAFRRDEIARISALRAKNRLRLRWGRIMILAITLVSVVAWALMFGYMAGEFMDRL